MKNMVNKKIYFDTNIVLDIIDNNRKEHIKAKKVWEYAIVKKYSIIISEDILTNVFYISKNKRSVLEFFRFIQNEWEIVPFGKNTIKQSIEFSLKNSCDLEDVLQCFCAKNNNCDIFITSDKKFIDCGIEILDYDEFFKCVE